MAALREGEAGLDLARRTPAIRPRGHEVTASLRLLSLTLLQTRWPSFLSGEEEGRSVGSRGTSASSDPDVPGLSGVWLWGAGSSRTHRAHTCPRAAFWRRGLLASDAPCAHPDPSRPEPCPSPTGTA